MGIRIDLVYCRLTVISEKSPETKHHTHYTAPCTTLLLSIKSGMVVSGRPHLHNNFSFILQNQYRHKADKSHWDLTTPPGAPQRTSWGSKSGRGSWPRGLRPRRMTTWPLCCWCSHWWRDEFCLSPEILRMKSRYFRLLQLERKTYILKKFWRWSSFG